MMAMRLRSGGDPVLLSNMMVAVAMHLYVF